MNASCRQGDSPRDFSLRPARSEDISGLLAIEDQAFSTDRLSRRSLLRFVASPSTVVIVAEVAGKLAGYALVLFRCNSFVGRLYSLAVAPTAVRRGLGKSLLAAAERTAHRRRCRALRLEVHEKNRAAARLYDQAGYRMFGRRTGYYQDGGAALLFEKRFALRGAGRMRIRPPLANRV